MKTVTDVSQLREQLAEWRSHAERIALVPTMGNLHAGHLQLMREAAGRAERVVATIFVNPMQFGAGEDLDSYPRTLVQDQQKLEQCGVDLLFAPLDSVIYPRGSANTTQVQVPAELTDQLCGVSRPGHFAGVATVVSKLFNLVKPDLALFGEKDFQQLQVIRRFVEDLNFPLQILGVPTQRDSDGLALSSRNGYLSAVERALAPGLYQTLCELADQLLAGGDVGELRSQALERLESRGLRPDYLEIRRADDLTETVEGVAAEELVLLAAVHLGRARLIDNLRLSAYLDRSGH